jgi:hypothetical protein
MVLPPCRQSSGTASFAHVTSGAHSFQGKAGLAAALGTTSKAATPATVDMAAANLRRSIVVLPQNISATIGP